MNVKQTAKSLFPFANKPRKLSPEEVAFHQKQAFLRALDRRIIDAEGMTEREKMALAVMYNDLSLGENNSPISVKRVKEFLETVIKVNNPSMYDRLIIFYEFFENDTRPEKKRTKEAGLISNYYESLRTLENAMIYSVGFEETAKKIAPKLDAPKEMSIIDRVKWLRVWFLVVRDHEFMFGDFNSKGQLLGLQKTSEFNHKYLAPEIMIDLEKAYFSRIPDGCIILELIQKFLSGFPKSVQDEVYRFGELDPNLTHAPVWRVEHVRNLVKKPMFADGTLRAKIFTYTTLIGLEGLDVEGLKLAVNTYKNGGISTLPTTEAEIYDVFNKFKKKNVTCYELGTTSMSEKLLLGSEHELMLYVNLYQWILEHPDFKFGKEQKTLSEYGMDNLLYSIDDAVTEWVLDCGLAQDKNDINFDSINAVLAPESNQDVFKKYASGEMSCEEVFDYFGFKSTDMARLVCSYTGLGLFNDYDFKAALKRVKMFGFDRSLQSDKLYVKVFIYLSESGISCGRSKKSIVAYRIPYAVSDFNIA